MENGVDFGYKDEIRSTRVGCMGSSDGAMLMRIASLGCVPKACMERMAVCRGLVEGVEIPQTAAVRAGDVIENAIYRHLVEGGSGLEYVSNPMLVSSVFSRGHVRLISHPDIYCEDSASHVLWLYEVKATKDGVDDTRYRYRAQLFVHFMLGREKASELSKRDGVKWKVRVVLVHYDTSGLDLESGVEFDPDRMTFRDVRMGTGLFDLGHSMDLVEACVSTMDEYYPEDEVDASLLPEVVRSEFGQIASALREIRERESKVADFKARLYEFMDKNGIKSVRCDAFTMTRVDASESHSFDSKRFVEDYAKLYPRKVKRLVRDYDKVARKKGYVKIDVKDADSK
jgi:hypothetical protein